MSMRIVWEIHCCMWTGMVENRLFGGGLFFEVGRIFDYDEYSQYADNKN